MLVHAAGQPDVTICFVYEPETSLAPHQTEREWARAMPPRRQREYLLGRTAARGVLPPGAGPVATGPAGEPQLDVAGVLSISHKHDAALAAYAADGLLGADLERASSDLQVAHGRPDISAKVMTARERADFLADDHAALIVFAAKEAAYKAGFARVGRRFGFLDVTISRTGPQQAHVSSALPGWVPLEATWQWLAVGPASWLICVARG